MGSVTLNLVLHGFPIDLSALLEIYFLNAILNIDWEVSERCSSNTFECSTIKKKDKGDFKQRKPKYQAAPADYSDCSK